MDLIKPELGLIFWTVIVFGLALFILAKYAWRPILNALAEREQSIEDALRKAEEAKKEMAALTADNEKILNEAKEERAKILKEAKEVHANIVDEAKDKAKQEAAKVVEDAKREIEIQKLAALTEVKNQVGLMAIDIAEKVLKKELADKKDQEAFVTSLVDDFKAN